MINAFTGWEAERFYECPWNIVEILWCTARTCRPPPVSPSNVMVQESVIKAREPARACRRHTRVGRVITEKHHNPIFNADAHMGGRSRINLSGPFVTHAPNVLVEFIHRVGGPVDSFSLSPPLKINNQPRGAVSFCYALFYAGYQNDPKWWDFDSTSIRFSPKTPVYHFP